MSATRDEAIRSFFVYVTDTNTGRIKRLAIPGDVQIGLRSNPAELTLLGRFSISTSDYVVGAGTTAVNVKSSDTIACITTPSSGVTRVTVNLPSAPRDGQLHFIKDVSGTAAAVPIDVFPATGAMIDQKSSLTLSDNYGSVALFWFKDRWRVFVGGANSSSGSSSGSLSASYVTVNPESGLPNARHVANSANITSTDSGPGSTISFNLTSILGGGAGSFTNANITADAFGRITAASNGSAGAPVGASYVTVSPESGLTSERALVAGTGILLVDGGANTGITESINNNIVATVSGTRFTGPVDAAGGLTGSLQLLDSGLAYLIGAGGITITTNSFGQVTIATSSSGAAVDYDPWTDLGNSIFTTSSVSVDSTGRRTSQIGTDVYFFVSGTQGLNPGTAGRLIADFGGDVTVSGSLTITKATSIDSQGRSASTQGTDNYLWVSGTINAYGLPAASAHKAVFGGDVYVSGGLVASKGLSGSLTKLADGATSYLAGGGTVFIFSQSNGQVVISGSGGGGSAMSITGSAVSRYQSIPLFIGSKFISDPSSSANSLGMNRFDPTKLNTTLGTQRFFFRSVFAPNSSPPTAYVDLYDYTGIVTGVPAPISGSVLTASSVVFSEQSVELTALFTAITGSGLIEARMWVTPTGSSYTGAVKNARIDVEWT